MAKRKKKRRSRSKLIVIAIVLIIAGFVVRRSLVPQFLHYLAYRPSQNRSPQASTPPSEEVPPPEETKSNLPAEQPPPVQPSVAPVATPSARKTTAAPHEHLTQSDRQQLEDILKRKSR